MVAYGEHERMVGDAAVAQMKSNYKNTLSYINRFMGLTSDCKEQVEEELKYIPNKVSYHPDKKLTFNLTNKGQNLDKVPEQTYAAFLKKLKKMFANEEDTVDLVLSVPAYYSSIERQAVLDACKIAKVNCLRLMNENTATALCYGFFRRKEFTEKARNVAFLDMGHGKTTCTVASFTSKKVTILSHASNRNLGGRNIDNLLCEALGKEFNDKYGCDPRKAPKARIRMLDQIQKTRKVLSANTESTINIECLLEDEDLHRNLTRDELEEMIQPSIDSLRELCKQALADSKVKTKDIDCIELVGEATRIPLVKRTVEEVFEKDSHQRTLNSSECVARGCSLMSAMILPQFQVANFEIQEYNPFPVDVSWSVSDGKMKTKTLFPKGNNFPSVKSLTFDGRSEPMDVGVAYHEQAGLLEGLPPLLARYRIEPPKPKEEKYGLKLRVQIDQNCVPGLDTAELIEEYIEVQKIPTKMDNKQKSAPKKDDKKEGEKEGEGEKEAEAPAEPEYQYEEKEVKKTRNTPIQFKFEQHGFGAKQIDEFIKAEDEMCKQDNLILEIKVKRNQLETYVYDMRASLDTIGNMKEYIKEDDRQKFLEMLNNTEEWIYDEGEAAAKDVYVQKLEELEKIGEPVRLRAKFHDIFPTRAIDFENFINDIHEKAKNIADDSHITPEEKKELVDLCQENLDWIANTKILTNKMEKYEDPAIDLIEIDQRRNKLQEKSNKILNKPVPPKKDEGKKEDKKDEKKEDNKQEEGENSNEDADMKDD